jgi:3-oxo-5alpha-steroid 4-dehydrogenase
VTDLSDDLIAPLPPLGVDDVPGWDHETDVLVVGLGAAGAAAAIAAADSGQRVVALERTGAGGGTSAMSGGILYLGGGTSTQTDAGFTDSVAEMQAFLAEVLGRDADDPRLAAYCAGSVEHHDWLLAHGLPVRGEFWPEPGMEPPGTEGLVFSGGENAAPYAARHRPVPRGHVAATPGATGGFLMECLLAAVAATDATVLTDARADQLVVDADGAVVGVRARVDGVVQHLRAGRTVLAAGGWAYNDELVRAHVPALLNIAWRLGTDNDDGWGLRVCQGVGAGLESLGTAEVALPITPPRRMVRCVLVNAQGERFVNEDTYFGHVGQAALLEQGGHVFMVMDEPRYEVNMTGLRATWVCETWDELGAEMGLPAGALDATMDAYNQAAAAGEDPAFGKDPEFVVPLTEGPFGAIDLRVAATIYAGFPLGGVTVDTSARVLRTDGTAVPGLFAVGRVASSLAAARYCSGISLGEGTFFGRVAATA